MRSSLIMLVALVTGCGTVGLAPSDTGLAASELLIDPYGEIDFGEHSINADKSALMDITLIVDGEKPLAILDMSLDGEDAEHFILPTDLPLPIPLQPGIDFPVSLRFSPDHVGLFMGELNIIIDDGSPENATLNRRIVGEGCDAGGC